MSVPESQQTINTLNDSINSLRSSVNVMAATLGSVATNMDSMVNIMEDFSRVTAKVQDKTEDMAGDFKNVVNYVDDIKASLGDMLVDAKKFRSSLDKKTYQQVAEQFDKIKKANESLLKSGKANTKQASAFREIISKCDEAMDRIRRGSANMADPLKKDVKLLNEMKGLFGDIVTDTERMVIAVNKVKLSGLHKAAVNLNSFLGRRSGSAEKLATHAQRAYEIQQARVEKSRGNKEAFKAKKEKAEKRLAEEFPEVFTNGSIDPSKLAKHNKAKRAVTSEMVEDGNFADRFLMDRMNSGKKGGLGSISGKLADLAESGGGSITKGLAGAAESVGTSGLLKFAGPAALAATAYEITKDAFNVVANQNKKYETTLGKGGLFTGGENGDEALNNAKDNLRAWGLNRYGVSSERQLAVAGAMADSGVNISSLATKGSGLAGGIGNIADISFKQAREIGLTDVEGVKQTLKLMQNYKLTLNGTQSFFQTIGKDIRASGISTTKYIELIDEITGKFGSMGNSIGTVTTILRSLGDTGTSTFNQLKDNVSALIGKEKTVEQKAFLFSTMKPKDRADYADAQEHVAGEAAEQFKQALSAAIDSVVPDKKADIVRNLDLTNVDDMDKALSRYQQAAKGKPGNPLSMQLEPLLIQAQAARISANAAKGNNPVGEAFTQVGVQSPTSQIVQTASSLATAFDKAGSSLGSFLKSTNQFNNRTSPLSTQVSTLTGNNPSQILQQRQTMLDLTNSALDEAIDGLKGEDQMNPKEVETLYNHLLEQAGMKKDKGKSAEQTIKEMSPDQSEKFRSQFIGNMSPGELARLIDSTSLINKSKAIDHRETLEEQAKKIAGISLATRTTDDILGAIKDAIVSKVGDPLHYLVAFFNNSSLAKGHDTQEAAVSSVNNPINKADRELVETLIKKNKDYKDKKGPMPDTSATDIVKNYDELSGLIDQGKATDSDIEKFNKFRDAMNAMSEHYKIFSGQGGMGSNEFQHGVHSNKPSLSHFLDADPLTFPVLVDNPLAGNKASAVKPDAGTRTDKSDAPSVTKNYSVTNNGAANFSFPTSMDDPHIGTEKPTQNQNAPFFQQMQKLNP